MKLISFSLWGDSKLYCQGAIDNIAIAKKHYHDWVCRFYVAQNCPAIPDLQKLDCQVNIIEKDCVGVDRTRDDWHKDINNLGMLWRFFAIDDPTVDVVIFRDCDSRVGARDGHAVKEWLNSGAAMHRMHECKSHWNAQAMGGMWGVRTEYLENIENSINNYLDFYENTRKEPWIFVDLWWIMDVLWPNLKDNCMGHGYGHPNQFKVDGPMVGGVVNESWRNEKYV